MSKVFQELLKPLQYKNSLEGAVAKIGMIIRFYFHELLNGYQESLKVFQNIMEKQQHLIIV